MDGPSVWEDVVSGAYYNTGFLRRFDDSGTPVSILAGSENLITVSVLPVAD